jgi:hypothetical protein
MNEFPDYFPSRNLFQNTINGNVTAYRLCGNNSICKEDFTSYYLINPEQYKINPNKFREENLFYYGLSFLQNKEECIILQKTIKWLKKKKYIAKANLNENHGEYKETPMNGCNSHITWWTYKNVTIEKNFKII